MANLFILLTTLILSSASFAAGDANRNDLVKKADSFRFISTDVSFQVEINDIKGTTTQKTRYKVFSKGSTMSRVETVFPERQAGRKLLMKGDDLWLFTPDVKRPTRVSMQQRLTGEVSNGDIARTNFADDYNGQLQGEEKIDGKDLYHLVLKKKRDEVTYSAIDLWIFKKDHMPFKAVFKTNGGKDLKVAFYREPKKMLDRILITQIEIQNSLNKEQKSILTFSGYKNEKLDESIFNKETLNN